jgi:hypothetical protein
VTARHVDDREASKTERYARRRFVRRTESILPRIRTAIVGTTMAEHFGHPLKHRLVNGQPRISPNCAGDATHVLKPHRSAGSEAA